MPPTLTTGAAGAVTGHAATLHGSVNAHGIPTSYRFEYGRTAAYDKATPTIAVGASLYAAAVATKVSGLTPATTYHYRIVASNGSGLVQGADHTFTTPGSTPPPPPPPPHAPFAGVGLVSTHLTTAGRFVTLKLSCPAGTIGSCSGKTKLSARKRRTGAKVRLGRVAFTIAPGRQAKVRLRVSRPGRRLLGHAARLHGRATSSARDTVGQAKTTVVAVTIRRRHA